MKNFKKLIRLAVDRRTESAITDVLDVQQTAIWIDL